MLIEGLVTLAARIVGGAVDPINWILAGAAGATTRRRPWILLISAIFAAARTAYVVVVGPPRPVIDLLVWWLAYAILFCLIAFLVAFIASRFGRARNPQAD